jgi:hypothetical protein
MFKSVFDDKQCIEIDNIKYYGFWPLFDPRRYLLHHVFREKSRPLVIIGPFLDQCFTWRSSLKFKIFDSLKADFFVTSENRNPLFRFAKKQIGFWRKYSYRKDVFRFPYWQWHLDWSNYRSLPPDPRYGAKISVHQLMQPIAKSFPDCGSRLFRASLISRHLEPPRDRLYNLINNTIGCDGCGQAFDKPLTQSKLDVQRKYIFSLCPENSLGDGYITEKIPEAFCSGCIPITFCHPDDLSFDFNPNAVVNLYGLDEYQVREIMLELRSRGRLFKTLTSEPLLLVKPALEPLFNFVCSS